MKSINQYVDFYERLLNEKCLFQFEYPQAGLNIAQIDNILIIAGSEESLKPLKNTSATILVDSIDDYKDFLLKNDASIIQDIQQVPTGFNMIIKHKDGITFEYVEHRTFDKKQ